MIGEAIREGRLKAKMSQTDLSKRMSVSRQTVQKWEKGINEPDLQTIKGLSSVLGVDLLRDYHFSNCDTTQHSSSRKAATIVFSILVAFILTILVLQILLG